MRQLTRGIWLIWLFSGLMETEHRESQVGQLRGGECGAACFMVLSGFVAQWQPALELRQLRRFFLRRFLRLWPAAWLAMAWTEGLVGKRIGLETGLACRGETGKARSIQSGGKLRSGA